MKKYMYTNHITTMNEQSHIIQEAVSLSMEAKELIAEEQLAIMSGFTDTDMKYLREFWPLVEHEDDMFVLTHEMIKTRLTNETGEDAVRDFYRRKLKTREFVPGIDYIELSSQETKEFFARAKMPGQSFGERRGGHNKKLYKITVSCYERLLMKAGTSDGMDMRNYFVKVHNLSKLKTRIMVEFRERMLQQQANHAIEEKKQLLLESSQAIEERDAQIRELTRSTREMKQTYDSLVNTLTIQENTVFAYIATSPSLILRSEFKPGKAKCLISRLSSYNTGRSADDRMYYIWTRPCTDASSIENFLKFFLGKHRQGKSSDNTRKCTEIYKIDPYVLINIMDAITISQNSAVSVYNTWINNVRENKHISLPAPSAIDHTKYRLDGTIDEGKDTPATEEKTSNIPAMEVKETFLDIDNGNIQCNPCAKPLKRTSKSSHIRSITHRTKLAQYNLRISTIVTIS